MMVAGGRDGRQAHLIRSDRDRRGGGAHPSAGRWGGGAGGWGGSPAGAGGRRRRADGGGLPVAPGGRSEGRGGRPSRHLLMRPVTTISLPEPEWATRPVPSCPRTPHTARGRPSRERRDR